MIFCCAILLMSVACSSVRVLSDYDRGVDFSQYKTFELSEPKDIDYASDPTLNQLNQNRLRKAITEQMVLRGYKESSTPDLMVNIYVKITEKKEVRTIVDPYFPYHGYYGYYGHWRYYNYWGPGWSYAETTIREYKEGTLIIDLVDTKKDQLVWHGVAIGTLKNLPVNPEERIRSTVQKLFDLYPYVAGNGHSMISAK